MLLFKGCEVFGPEPLGKKDVLLAGKSIAAISDDIRLPENLEVTVVDASGLKMIPGLIDSHVHIAGAGGEGGPASRTPELQLSQMLEAGVTTVIGCMGTDGITRSLEAVLMKAKGLRQEGVSAWIYTGSYQVPTPTLLGDISKDIALIDEVIGAGEIAISDHRSSCPTNEELRRIAAQARLGGMLGGKAGIVNIHMGDARKPFNPLYQVVQTSELKLTQFLPTHINRNHYIFEDALEYGKKGYVDLTASSYPYFPEIEIKPSRAIKTLLEAGVPLGHITMSSDGMGSLPHFDEKGQLVQLEMGQPKSVFCEMRDAVIQEKIPLGQALQVVTSNVADILWLKNKGRIAPGKDADLVLIDREFRIVHLTALGQLMVHDRKVLKKGSYEK